ncbi:DUF1801 domain-containing protein [Brumimicrobium mesophilum]|uniref:DUF1801 domain-containing protein n=1 Tax=Brumimicrobium mesophilum TaxID=392717 RepID=UPI000D14287F|nr:DUF1801 domain-containing protein [Brumimicrobium mesophilum]
MTIQDYIDNIAEDKKEAFLKLQKTIQDNIPKGFEETVIYKMVGYVVPKETYPAGYHCDTSLPLPFINIAAQKNFIAVYHMGIYANPELLAWFVEEYPKHAKTKLDMGKSCIRFKKMNDVPYELVGELMKKMTVEDWIGIYEGAVKR